MDVIQKIRTTVEPSLTDMGYRIVLLKLNEGAARTLTLMAERLDDVFMSFDDCTEISHRLGTSGRG